MISIGIVLKGAELSGSPIDRAIMAAARASSVLRGSFEFGIKPAVNIVFYVPGSVGRPNWNGIRDAKFSRQQQLLMVQVSVPVDAVESANPIDFVIESLRGANAVAFEYFQRRGLQFELAKAEELVSNIRSRIQSIR